jgi:phosphoribosylformylglycinamidine synthase
MLPAAPPYSDFAPPADLNAVLLDLLARPDVADKSLIHDRFDQTVGNCTVRGPTQACAAVLQVPDSARGFALVLTGRGELCAVDPYLGAQAAVAEALRRLACAGARLLAITDGINCASPRDPIENRRLAALIQGLGDALRALDVPVTGGNVSLYNESPDGPIPPTPMVGGLGVIEDIAHVPASALQPGLEIFLLGALRSDPVTCRYGALRTGLLAGGVPAVDLAAEQRLAAWLLRQTRRVVACQPTRLGGLAVALAKLCVRGGCGATLDALPSARPDWALFGEYPAQVFVAVRPNDAAALIQDAEAAGIPWLRAGLSGGDALQIEPLPPIPLSVLASAYRGAKGPDARA